MLVVEFSSVFFKKGKGRPCSWVDMGKLILMNWGIVKKFRRDEVCVHYVILSSISCFRLKSGIILQQGQEGNCENTSI